MEKLFFLFFLFFFCVFLIVSSSFYSLRCNYFTNKSHSVFPPQLNFSVKTFLSLDVGLIDTSIIIIKIFLQFAEIESF